MKLFKQVRDDDRERIDGWKCWRWTIILLTLFDLGITHSPVDDLPQPCLSLSVLLTLSNVAHSVITEDKSKNHAAAPKNNCRALYCFPIWYYWCTAFGKKCRMKTMIYGTDVQGVVELLPLCFIDVSTTVAGSSLLLFLVLKTLRKYKQNKEMFKNQNNHIYSSGIIHFLLLLALQSLPCTAHKAWSVLPGHLLGGVWVWSGSVRGQGSPRRTRSPLCSLCNGYSWSSHSE